MYLIFLSRPIIVCTFIHHCHINHLQLKVFTLMHQVGGWHLYTQKMQIYHCHLSQCDAQDPHLQRPLSPQHPLLLQAQQHLLGKNQIIIRHYKTQNSFCHPNPQLDKIIGSIPINSIFIDVTIMTFPPVLPSKETSFKTVTLNRAHWTPGSVTAAREAWAAQLILEKLLLKLRKDMPG